MSSGQCTRRPRKKAKGALAIELPAVERHPNRLPFEGCLTLVDIPSDKPPSGGRGHRVILERRAAMAGLPSLLGMAVSFRAGWEGHDARQKCGLITRAELVGDELIVGGHIYERDFPEIGQAWGKHELGMSYEMADCYVRDMRAPVWTVERTTFMGAAILLRQSAAYRKTWFKLLDEPRKSAAKAIELGARKWNRCT